MVQTTQNSSNKDSEFGNVLESNSSFQDAIGSKNVVDTIFEKEGIKNCSDSFQVATTLEEIIKKYNLGEFGFDFRAGKSIFRCENNSKECNVVVETLFKKTLNEILKRDSFQLKTQNQTTSMIFR